MYSAVASSTYTNVYRNGILLISNPAKFPGPNGITFGQGASSEYSNCEVSEVVAFNVGLADADRLKMDAYFQKKYQLW